MAHAYHHAESSARRFGGIPDDYVAIHTWFDQTKAAIAHPIHRALRHHAWGVFEAERIFGVTITNSDGNRVPVRLVGEQHVREDCGGRVPSVADWLANVTLQGWMLKGRIEEDGADAEDGTLGLDAWTRAVMEQRTMLGYAEWRAQREGRPVPMPVLEIALAHLPAVLVGDLVHRPPAYRQRRHCLFAAPGLGVLLHVPGEPGEGASPAIDRVLAFARERGAAMVHLGPDGAPVDELPLHEEAVA